MAIKSMVISKVPRRLIKNSPKSTKISSSCPHGNPDGLLFNYTVIDVREAVTRLRVSAPGPDGITAKQIKSDVSAILFFSNH